MGLLDDAIREHLDLKRRRGADPSEVERAEREALGPVRRVQAPEMGEVDEADDPEAMEFDHEVEPAAGMEFEHEVEPADGIHFAHEDSGPAGAAFDHEDDDESWSYEAEPPAEPPAEPVGQETAVHRPDFLDAEEFDEPEFEPRRDAPPPHPAAGETVQYDVERDLAGSEAEPGEHAQRRRSRGRGRGTA